MWEIFRTFAPAMYKKKYHLRTAGRPEASERDCGNNFRPRMEEILKEKEGKYI